MDQFGQGQPVQYSLIETNGDWHMAKCLDHFKRANEHWRFVRIVIVDKDIREVKVIRKKLPEARNEAVLAQMKHITNMTYPRTEEGYHMHRGEVKSLSCQDDRTKLWEYFDKNRNDCCEMWVKAYRVDLPHFGNHTNNRVESLFGKLKRQLKSHFTMQASLKVLVDYQRRKEEEYWPKVEMPGTGRVLRRRNECCAGDDNTLGPLRIWS
ncbi:hypothetical protein F443_06581 [Phytophthora nicotianae P1569]|uniref:ZSWIM1/3 RNaseH-like domain-containing protein n=1 Tax=Phytophthora nicotianae P1569 TaxID=1317065 RepID=V9FGD2_PHYNI|nr:hypothetical protein F443_06581 [Phytophthora nicotianae P1569]